MTNQQVEEVTLRQILEEIRDGKEEVKGYISATETKLLLEIQSLKKRNEILEGENEKLKNRLEKTERLQKKNNIIIFGLEANSKLTSKYICTELNRLLSTRVETSEINDYYKLGDLPNSPIKVEFVSYQTKKYIFDHTKNLRGTAVSVAHDLTPEQRQENRRLRPFLLKARKDSTEKSFIKGNKLVIGQGIYDLADLERTEGRITTSNTASSEGSGVNRLEGSALMNSAPEPSKKNENTSFVKLLIPSEAPNRKYMLRHRSTTEKDN